MLETAATSLINKAAETNGFGYGLVGVILIILIAVGCFVAVKFTNAHFEHIKELRESNAQQAEIIQEFSKQISNLAASVQVTTQALNESKTSTSQSLIEAKNQISQLSLIMTRIESVIAFCQGKNKN